MSLENIQWWLDQLPDELGKGYKYQGNTLTRGIQKDFVSCIPISMNTISHGIFGDPLWKESSKFDDRATWFVRLVPELSDSFVLVSLTLLVFIHSLFLTFSSTTNKGSYI